MGLSRRTQATISRANSSVGARSTTQVEVLPPFGQGAKAGASGIAAADVPAIKRSYQLLEGLSLVSTRVLQVFAFAFVLFCTAVSFVASILFAVVFWFSFRELLRSFERYFSEVSLVVVLNIMVLMQEGTLCVIF